jgi:hypothetical protein
LSSHHSRGLSTGFQPWIFSIPYFFQYSSICTVCPAHFNLLNFIHFTIFCHLSRGLSTGLLPWIFPIPYFFQYSSVFALYVRPILIFSSQYISPYQFYLTIRTVLYRVLVSNPSQIHRLVQRIFLVFSFQILLAIFSDDRVTVHASQL